MTKEEKIKSLATAMTQSKRGGNEDNTFYHFTETAPSELKDIFLENYEVRDIDYETFSRACDVVSEVYSDNPTATDDEATEDIYERASDSASVYTSARLTYLNIWNEEDISDTMREYGEHSIATACAIWYDKQVEQAAILIKDWVNEINFDNVHNPDICPSSLDEYGEPSTPGNTAHKWDESTSPITCAECGTTKE